MQAGLENNIHLLKPLLHGAVPPKVVITTHHKPDADALGSSLGLYNYLVRLNIPATVVSPTDYGVFLHWMPGNNTVINFEERPEASARLVEEADLIFCLDFNALKRINDLGNIVAASKAKKVMIDHHEEPEGFSDFRLWTVTASSTCELIYEFIIAMGDEELINEDIASCLYAGIMTDTGSFRFKSCTAVTHRIVANLLDKGVQNHLIHQYIFDNYSEKRTRLLGYVLFNKMEILHEYNTVIITLNRNELKEYGVTTGDTEGFVNYGLTIRGIKLSILVIDRTKMVKMSFRSKGGFPANEFAKKL